MLCHVAQILRQRAMTTCQQMEPPTPSDVTTQSLSANKYYYCLRLLFLCSVVCCLSFHIFACHLACMQIVITCLLL